MVNNRVKSRTVIGILFSIPAIICFCLFKYYPLFKTIGISLYDYEIMNPPGEFIGLQNYIHSFSNSLVLISWKNNIILFTFGLLLGFWVPLVQAVLVDEIRKGKTLFRILFFIPASVPAIVNLLVWKLLYNPDWGFLNGILEKVGLPAFDWLNSTKYSKLVLALPGLLGGGGLGFLIGGALSIFIYLAALQGIPSELYEASSIDGANAWIKFKNILLPQLKSIIAIQFILALSVGFQFFDAPFILTEGGPVNTTRVIALSIYYYAFKLNKMGYASALAVMLFILVSILTILRLRYSKDI